VSVGGQLTSARLALGLQIEDVSDRTRVRAQLLRAIEADDFSKCGGDVYARGHLRAFAGVVGLDAAPLLAEYDREFRHLEDEDTVPVEVVEPGAFAPMTGTFTSPPRPVDVREPHRLSWTGAAVLAAGVAVVVAVIAFVTSSSGPDRRTPVAAPKAGVTTSAPAPSPSAAVVAPPTAVAQGVDVVVRAVSGPSWVGLLPNYKVQVTLQKGQTKEFKDARQVDLRIGNPAAVELVVNGQVMDANGSNNPVNRTFKATSYETSIAPTQN
jgi:cytoskeleton protein RodZ